MNSELHTWQKTELNLSAQVTNKLERLFVSLLYLTKPSHWPAPEHLSKRRRVLQRVLSNKEWYNLLVHSGSFADLDDGGFGAGLVEMRLEGFTNREYVLQT